jgi:acyl-CoA synthetase (AMP-forming)/AMP-acid ligase II/acyl carrier protein
MRTSGTTGAPKEVAITHEALTSFLRWYLAETRIGSNDRVSQRLPLGFDASLSEILPALAVGAEVDVARDLGSLGPHDVLARVAGRGVTVLTLPAAYFAELAQALDGGETPGLPALRLVVVGGDTLAQTDVARWRERYPNATVVNAYGLTEATIASTLFPADGATVVEGDATIAIGRPGGSVQVLDSAFRPCAAGAAGEVWVTGPTVTATPLRGRVFRSPSGVRALRTGDFARMRADGTVELTGRRDGQVKVRGQRVDLRATAAVVATTLGVARAVVQQESTADGRSMVVAYVEGRDESLAGDPRATRASLARRLPAAALPRYVVIVPQIPYTARGNVDRRRLTEAFAAAFPLAHAALSAGDDEVSGRIRALWSDAGVSPGASAEVSFFDAGGDSLAAVRLLNLLERELGVRLDLAAILSDGSVRDLAERVRRARAERNLPGAT